MKKRLTAFIIYAIFWLVFFFFARIFFLMTHYKEAFQFAPSVLAATFLHGIKLDISAFSYILVIPFIFSVAEIWIKGRWVTVFLMWYTAFLIFIFSVIIVSDTLLYTYWGFRMDYTPLLYLKTPKEAAASVSLFQILSVCVTVILITILFVFLYRRFVHGFFENSEIKTHRITLSFSLLVMTGALIIPIRGGLGLAPINAGTVYFNENMFINHAAINVVWNVGSSVFNRKPGRNPYEYENIASAKALTDYLLPKNGLPGKVLNNMRPNILIIVLESFGSALIGPLGGDSLTTPRLNKYIKEGLLFSEFYSSGNRTDKALPAILNGYPAQPATSIIKEPKKTQTLRSLVKTLDSMNYKTSFWYGGDINFANFNSFVIGTGFHQVITKDNFNKSDYNSKWGVHDHILFKVLADSMKLVRQPFLSVVLTLSSHEPFEVPVTPVFNGKDEYSKFRNSVHYTDSTLGDFLDRAKNTEWWKNTLVILLGDHYRRNFQKDLVYSQSVFRIPMVWLGGALETKGKRVQKIGTQVDIPLTLLDQMEVPCYFPFAKDLLSGESKSFAFYTFNEGFAFITDSSTLIYDHKLGKPVIKAGKSPEAGEKFGKAYLEVLYNDYLKR